MTQIIEVLQGGQPVNVEFPDDMSLDDIAEALQGFPTDSAAGQTFAPVEPIVEPPESTVFEELQRGFSRLGVDFNAFAQSFSNPEEAALEALKKQAEVSQRLGKPPSLEDTVQAYKDEGVIGAAGEILTDIPRITAQQLPTTATVLGGTALGTAALGPLGGIAGGYAALYPQLYSQNIQRQAEADIQAGREVDINRTKAALAAVAQTGAEQAATYFTFGKGLVSRLLGLRPSQLTPRSSSALVNIARDSLGGVARGAAIEMPTEVAQQVIERAQADLDVLSDEALTEYGEAGYMAAIAGGTIGGVSGAASPIFTPTTVEQPGQLPTTEDLSEITQTEDIVTPDLPTTEPTPDLSEDTTLPPLEERLSLIAPNLRGTLKGRGLDDVGLELSTRLDPKALQGMRDPDEVDAIFDPDLNTIFLGADRIKGFEQMDTPQLQREFSGLVDHEMVHAVKRMNLWKDSEWKVLENAARRRTNAEGRTYMDAAISDYSQETAEIQTEEAVAELIRDTLAGRTGLAGQPLSLIQRFVEFFRKMGNALTGTGYASFNQVVNDIETGVTGGRPRVAQPEAEATIIGEPALASRRRPFSLVQSDRQAEDDVGILTDRVLLASPDPAALSRDDTYTPQPTAELDVPQGVYVDEPRDVSEGSRRIFMRSASRLHKPSRLAASGSRDYIGYILHSGNVHVVHNADNQIIGSFPTEQEALDTLSTKGRVMDQLRQDDPTTGIPTYPVQTKPLASRRALRQDDNRLQQAKDQGFDTDRVLYHFTDKFQFGGKEFESIIPSAAGKLGPGIYTSPDAAYSQTYLKSPEIRGSRGIAGYARGPIANQSDYQAAIDFAVDDYRSRTDDPINNVQVKRLAKEILEEQGFTGLEMEFPRGTEVVVFNPKDFRSINAEFDPRATDSTRLLASRKRLPHGLPEFLTVDSSGKKPTHKVVQNFTPSNRSKITNNITKVLENNPEALATYNAWINAEEDAFGGDKVPAPPFQAIEYAANPELLADKLNQLTPELKATVDEGFGYVNEIKDIYESGEATPELTGRLFLWGILSRGAGPVQQEAAFLNILNAATPFISKSASGNMTQTDLDSWAKTVSGILPEGSPARSVTMNVNAAGKLLFELGKTAEGSDRSVLSVLHDSLSDPSQSAADFRRKFFSLTNKPGIDNKVVSFISLVGGKPDVLVMDRIQSRHLWDDGRFDGANIYDGIKIEGRDQGTGLNEILAGPRGLLVTEMLENGLRDSVNQAYEIVGRPEDASLGRMHWETWVIEGNQGVPHSTLQAVKTGSPTGYSVTEGKRGTYTSGATFRQTENGLIVEYPLSDGTKVRMTPTQFIDFKNTLVSHQAK